MKRLAILLFQIALGSAIMIFVMSGCAPSQATQQAEPAHKIGTAYFCVQLGDQRSACLENATPKQQAAIDHCAKPELVHVDRDRFAKCVNAQMRK